MLVGFVVSLWLDGVEMYRADGLRAASDLARGTE